MWSHAAYLLWHDADTLMNGNIIFKLGFYKVILDFRILAQKLRWAASPTIASFKSTTTNLSQVVEEITLQRAYKLSISTFCVIRCRADVPIFPPEHSMTMPHLPTTVELTVLRNDGRTHHQPSSHLSSPVDATPSADSPCRPARAPDRFGRRLGQSTDTGRHHPAAAGCSAWTDVLFFVCTSAILNRRLLDSLH